MSLADRPSYPSRTHAVVIGGSLAGLLAARVLGEHFERVTILERDPVVYSQFLRVMNLMAFPGSLLRPALAWRVLRGGFS